MDKIDAHILSVLQENARTPNTEIAKQLGMVPSAILERIRKLESRGIIKKYRAELTPSAIGLNILAYIIIDTHIANWSDEIGAPLKAISNAEEVHEILGQESYLVKVRVRDMDELSKILKDQIGKIPNIKSTRTLMVTNTVKEYGPNPV